MKRKIPDPDEIFIPNLNIPVTKLDLYKEFELVKFCTVAFQLSRGFLSFLIMRSFVYLLGFLGNQVIINYEKNCNDIYVQSLVHMGLSFLSPVWNMST